MGVTNTQSGVVHPADSNHIHTCEMNCVGKNALFSETTINRSSCEENVSTKFPQIIDDNDKNEAASTLEFTPNV